MIVEVIAVGTELLLGQIVNTNAATIGTRMAEDGFDVNHQVTVGDNLDRIVESLRLACSRADAVVMTGGIGPTQDDMTRDAICAFLGVGITRDPQHAEMIRARSAARGAVAHTSLKMADYPTGAEPLTNRTGVALGIATSFNDTLIFAVPGVPKEMGPMIDHEVRPRLRAASGEPAVLQSRVLHTWGRGESQIGEMLDDLYETSNPSIAFLIRGPEVRIRITAKAVTEIEVSQLISEVEDVVRERLGDGVFGVDDETVDGIVTDQLAQRGWSIASVESTTGGAVAARLSLMPAFAGGRVIPSAPSMGDLEEQAIAMLDEDATGADVTISVSEMERQDSDEALAGRRVAVAVRTPNGTEVRTLSVIGNDERAREFAVPGAMHTLRKTLHKDAP
jgi:nicotinamide-nucleotide amidase